jgi:hypothetical protein
MLLYPDEVVVINVPEPAHFQARPEYALIYVPPHDSREGALAITAT